ncbi:MAG: MATE family efflux transporter [Gammaproteobacteria bacterium]|nr:MATE family efflux transporter [Gammaproteobacteria bacterium]
MQGFFSKPAVRKETCTMLKLAFPAVVAQVAQMSLGAIDTIMAGNLSTNSLAAISVGSNLFIPLLVFSLGIFMSLNPLVSQANGAGRYNKLGEYLRQGLYLALLVSIPSILIINHLTPLMELIGVQESVIPVVDGYLQALSWGVLSLYLFFVLRSVNEGLFSTKAIMYTALAAIPVNILLNYIFMYGYLGIPALGAVGLGYATALVWTLMFITLLLYTLFSKKYSQLVFFTHFHKPEWKVFKEILHIGIPMALTVGMEVLMFGAVGLFIARFSIETIAAHQIAINFSGLLFMVPMGLSIAVSARVGNAVGRSSAKDVQLAAKLGLIFSVIFMACAATVTLLMPAQIISIYSNESSVIDIGAQLLLMAAIYLIFDGLQVTTAGALRGMKDTLVPMFLSGISYWIIGFPIGFYMAEFMGYQAIGYWIGFIAGLSTSAILLGFRLRFLLKRITSMLV